MVDVIPLTTIAAAHWLAEHWDEAKAAPSLYFFVRRRFGLGANQSIKIIAKATVSGSCLIEQ